MSAPYRRQSTLAIVSLVSGVLGVLPLPVLASVVAIITGHLARAEIRRDPGHWHGDGMAVAGLVLGYLMLGLWLLGGAMLLLFLGGLAWLAVVL